MISEKLEKARAYEAENEKKITPLMRPVFHLTPRVGWMNDPNGFSYYNGCLYGFFKNRKGKINCCYFQINMIKL